MTDPGIEAMIANLPERTGRSLGEWLALLNGLNLNKHGQIVGYLKTEHSVTHGFANLIANRFLAVGSPEQSEDQLVDAQYEGAKAALRPIYEQIIAAATSLGSDVQIAPKKSSVSLRRSKQFGLITAATKSRIDVGINLPGEQANERLQAATGMCTHRIAVSTPDDVDAELIGYLRDAYNRA